MPRRFIVGLGFILLCSGLRLGAQSGSAPVGVVSYTAPANSTISVGVPLLRPTVEVAVVGSISGATLVFSGAEATVAVSLAEGEAFFVEVIGQIDGATSALIGHRFEINETATRAGAAGSVSLDLSSPLNTGSTESISNLVGHRVAIRPHWTLAALFGTGSNARVNAGLSAATADQVLAWNGAGFSVYYLRGGDVGQWRNSATGAANQDGAILPPGVGIFLRRRAGAVSFSLVGEVRTNSFVRSAFSGSQLVASGFPVDSSPADWRLTSGTGLTTGTSPATADQLLNWAGSAFNVFYLRDGVVPEWRNMATGTIDYSGAKLFSSYGATMLMLRAAASGTAPVPLVQPVPFSL